MRSSCPKRLQRILQFGNASLLRTRSSTPFSTREHLVQYQPLCLAHRAVLDWKGYVSLALDSSSFPVPHCDPESVESIGFVPPRRLPNYAANSPFPLRYCLGESRKKQISWRQIMRSSS